MPTRPVAVIIGMMGAGKTRVGKEVAQLMSLPFADADVEIEHEVGMRIPEYFERHGEPAFREVESEVIAGMLHGFGGVFALGGGATAGRQIWLQTVPADQLPACLPSLDYMLQAFPFQEIIRVVLHGSADCAEVNWTLFGLSIPELSLLGFVVCIGLALYQGLRRS